jgi:hypothetical protein
MQMHEFQCGATNRPFLAGAAGSGLISLNFAKSKSSTHLLDITAPLKIGLDVSSTFKAHSFDDRLKAPTSPPVKTSKDEITGQQLNCEKPWQIYNNDPNAVGELESLPPITKKPQALTQDFDTEAAASFLRKPDSLLSQTKASSRAIAPSGITNFSWARKLWKFSGKDGVVDYWINKNGKGLGHLAMSDKEAGFVQKTFRFLGRITGLRFVERGSKRQTDIDVHCADDLGGDTVGIAFQRKGWFDVKWEDRAGWRLTRYEKYVIRHEIGHVLGLDHPFGSGYNSRYDTRDTLMSYNWAGNTNYTRSDINALQALWVS